MIFNNLSCCRGQIELRALRELGLSDNLVI